jgi:hypothetical protein
MTRATQLTSRLDPSNTIRPQSEFWNDGNEIIPAFWGFSESSSANNLPPARWLFWNCNQSYIQPTSWHAGSDFR